MKYTFILIFFALLLSSCERKDNDVEINKKIKASELSKIDLRKYYGRSINELLEDIETKPTRIILTSEPPECIHGSLIVYPNDTVLYVFFNRIYFQKQCDSLLQRNVELITKEFIYRMGLHIKGMPVNMEYFGPNALDKEKYRKRMRESVKA